MSNKVRANDENVSLPSQQLVPSRSIKRSMGCDLVCWLYTDTVNHRLDSHCENWSNYQRSIIGHIKVRTSILGIFRISRWPKLESYSYMAPFKHHYLKLPSVEMASKSTTKFSRTFQNANTLWFLIANEAAWHFPVMSQAYDCLSDSVDCLSWVKYDTHIADTLSVGNFNHNCYWFLYNTWYTFMNYTIPRLWYKLAMIVWEVCQWSLLNFQPLWPQRYNGYY